MEANAIPHDGGLFGRVLPLRLVGAVPGVEATWNNAIIEARVRYWTASEWQRLPLIDRPEGAQPLGEGYAALTVDWA